MTKRILRHASVAGAVAAGSVLLLGGAAQAAGPDILSAGNHGIANGNQAVVPVQAPIDVCGNAVSALVGLSGAGCTGGSDAKMKESGDLLGDMTTAGNNGILNGNQLQAPIQAPINVCGNAVAVAGVSGAGCKGGSDAKMKESGDLLGDMTTAGNRGIGNGNQVQAPIQVPINVCGNAVAVLGVAGAGCTGGADADMGGHHGHHAKKYSADMNVKPASHKVASEGTKTAEGGHDNGLLGDMTSAGNNGILNGNQLQAPIQVPIDVSGNAIAVLGVAGAGSTGGSSASMG